MASLVLGCVFRALSALGGQREGEGNDGKFHVVGKFYSTVTPDQGARGDDPGTSKSAGNNISRKSDRRKAMMARRSTSEIWGFEWRSVQGGFRPRSPYAVTSLEIRITRHVVLPNHDRERVVGSQKKGAKEGGSRGGARGKRGCSLKPREQLVDDLIEWINVVIANSGSSAAPPSPLCTFGSGVYPSNQIEVHR